MDRDDISFDGFSQEQAEQAIRVAAEAVRPILAKAAAMVLVTVLTVAVQAGVANAQKQIGGVSHRELEG